MRILKTLLIISVAVGFILTLGVPNSSSATMPKADRGEIYQRFGEMLEALASDALRENDLQTIRENAAELVRRGKAVVSFGRGELPKDFRRDAARALRSLDRALTSFNGAARSGNDARLKQSLVAVREAYDELATMYLGCKLPPTVVVRCPADTLAGAEVEVVAVASEPEHGELLFTWTLSEGQIVPRQGANGIVIPTTGLGGKTIKVDVTVDDRSGLTAISSCSFKVLNP